MLLGRLQNDIAEALRFSHGLTLIVCEIAGDELRISPRSCGAPARCCGSATTSPPVDDPVCHPAPFLRRPDAPPPRKLPPCSPPTAATIRLAAASAPYHALDLAASCASLNRHLSASPAIGNGIAIRRVAGASERPPRSLSTSIRALNERDLGLAPRTIVDAHHLTPALSRMETTISGVTFDRRLPTPPPLFWWMPQAGTRGRRPRGHADARIVLPIAPATLRNREWLSVLAAHLGARPGYRVADDRCAAGSGSGGENQGARSARRHEGARHRLVAGWFRERPRHLRSPEKPADRSCDDRRRLHPKSGALDRRPPLRAHARGYRPTSRHRHVGRMGRR